MAFDAVPVTSPVRSPTKLVEVVTPVANTSPSGLNVTPDPTRVLLENVPVVAVNPFGKSGVAPLEPVIVATNILPLPKVTP